jgi:hypothetical protein
MYLPKNFKLFQQTWTIRAAGPGEIDSDLGQCRPDQLEILINHNQVPESMSQTLCHELVHSIEQKLMLELTERQVDLIALGIIDLFSSNPDLIADILGEWDEE